MTTTIWTTLVLVAVGLVLGPVLSKVVASSAPPLSDGDRPIANRSGNRRMLASPAVGLSLVLAALEGWAGLRFGRTWSLPPVAVFLAGLITLAWCDATYYRLPTRILRPTVVVSGALLVLAAGVTSEWTRFGLAVACAAVAFAAFFVMNLVNPRGMAFGDVRLAGMIGLVLGWRGPTRALDAFVIAIGTAGVAAVILLVARRVRLDSHLPYGVFLATGAVLALLW